MTSHSDNIKVEAKNIISRATKKLLEELLAIKLSYKEKFGCNKYKKPIKSNFITNLSSSKYLKKHLKVGQRSFKYIKNLIISGINKVFNFDKRDYKLSVLSKSKEHGVSSIFQQEKFIASNSMMNNFIVNDNQILKKEFKSKKNTKIQIFKTPVTPKIIIAENFINIKEKNPIEKNLFPSDNFNCELTFSKLTDTFSKPKNNSPVNLENKVYDNIKLIKNNKKNEIENKEKNEKDEISEFNLPIQSNHNLIKNTCDSQLNLNTSSNLLSSAANTKISKNKIKEDYSNKISKISSTKQLDKQSQNKFKKISFLNESSNDYTEKNSKNLNILKPSKLNNDIIEKNIDNIKKKFNPLELLEKFKTNKDTTTGNINKSDFSIWLNSSWTKTLQIKGKKTNLFKNLEERKIFCFKNIYDSMGSDEYKSEDEEGKVIMWENSPFRKFYGFIMLICIFYSCTISPYYMAFNVENPSITVLETLMDGLFLTEIIFNFLTPYKEGDQEITNQVKMLENYLKNGFFFDIISSIPNSLMSSLGAKNFNLKMMRLLKVTRMFKLIKWLATIKVNNGENEDFEDTSMDRLMKLLVFFVILSHISTCMWIYVGLNVWNSEGNSWIPYHGFAESNNLDIYVSSLYYNLVTIFTIGYGDIHSVTITETTYIICFMFISTLMWSFAVSSMSQIFLNMSIEHKKISEKMKILNDINEKHLMNRELYVNISHNLKHSKEVNNEKFKFLETLPYTLKKECLISMTKKGIKSLNFFKGQNREFFIFVLPMLHSMSVTKNECLISFRNFIEEMYIVKKGTLAIRLGHELGNVEVSQVPEKNHFGEIFMYVNEFSQFSVSSRSTLCDLFCISKSNFTKIKMSYNDIIFSILFKSCVLLERIEKLKNIVVEFFNLGLTIKQIKSLIKKLNFFCFHGQLDSFLKMEELGIGSSNIEDVEDFILSNDTYDLVNFLNSQMEYKDFLKCFFEKVKNPNLRFPTRGKTKTTYLQWNNISYQRKNVSGKDKLNSNNLNIALESDSNLKVFQMYNHAELKHTTNEDTSSRLSSLSDRLESDTQNRVIEVLVKNPGICNVPFENSKLLDKNSQDKKKNRKHFKNNYNSKLNLKFSAITEKLKNYKEENNFSKDIFNYNINFDCPSTIPSFSISKENAFNSKKQKNILCSDDYVNSTDNSKNQKLNTSKFKTSRIHEKTFKLSNIPNVSVSTKEEFISSSKPKRISKANLKLENHPENICHINGPSQIYNIFNYGGYFNQNFIYARNESLKIIKNESFNLNSNYMEKSKKEKKNSIFNDPILPSFHNENYDDILNTFRNTHKNYSKNFSRINTNSENIQLINYKQNLHNSNLSNSSSRTEFQMIPIKIPVKSKILNNKNNNLINPHNFSGKNDPTSNNNIKKKEIKEISYKKNFKHNHNAVLKMPSSVLPIETKNENSLICVSRDTKIHTPNETQLYTDLTNLNGIINKVLPLPCKNQKLKDKIGIESKSSQKIFQEVTNALYIDEMFHLDKHFIKDKIDKILRERREISQTASRAYKKLKNIHLFITYANK